MLWDQFLIFFLMNSAQTVYCLLKAVARESRKKKKKQHETQLKT